MRLLTSPTEPDRQNGMVTDSPDGAAQQAADERERAPRKCALSAGTTWT
jgi:hypothetical protein